ncbi:MAG: hypothetical protein J6T15_04725 [Bacilli bacterium]|nr:hypothetical protein [Bacilli bacterium]
MEEIKTEGKDYEEEVRLSALVIKYLCAIMNEEEDIEAYSDKTPEETVDIWNSILARYPDNTMASLDPMYTILGQVCMNGYKTFGIDFLKVLVNRKDETPKLCIKGLIDYIDNLLVQNEFIALDSLPEEEREKVMRDFLSLSNEEEK